MNSKNKAVLGIFKTRTEVERAIDALKSDRFSADDISVLMPDSSGSQDFAYAKVTKAKACLESTGATDISSTGESKGEWRSYAIKSKTDLSKSPTMSTSN